MTRNGKARRKKAARKMQLSPRQKLHKLGQQLNSKYVERQHETHGLLLSLLSRQHMLLLGPPGSAKSALTEDACKAIGGGYFDVLLSKFSVPEQLFGPFKLSALKRDKMERDISGMLPEATISFVDECFKASSSILNSLLRIINERKFRNGSTTIDCPLVTMVGASNEMPESDELNALYDRFLLRYWTGYIKDPSEFESLLHAATNGHTSITATLTLGELEAAQEEVDEVDIPADVLSVLVDLKAKLEAAGIVASDRRWVSCLVLLRAQAWLQGRDTVEAEDIAVLQHALWHDPKDRQSVASIVVSTANPLQAEIDELVDAAQELFRSINQNQHVPDERQAELVAQVSKTNGELKKIARKLQALDEHKTSEAVGKIKTWSRQLVRYTSRLVGADF